MRKVSPIAAVVTVIVAFSCPAFSADSVYKCVINGKTRYTATPPATDGQCQETLIRDDGPSPEEWARIQEERNRRQEEERQANEAALKEREVRAKELEASAAARAARAEEQQLLLQRQQQYVPEQTPVYMYPYWGGGFGRPIPPSYHPPLRPHQVPQASQFSPGYPTPSPGYPTPSPGYPTPSPGFPARR